MRRVRELKERFFVLIKLFFSAENLLNNFVYELISECHFWWI